MSLGLAKFEPRPTIVWCIAVQKDLLNTLKAQGALALTTHADCTQQKGNSVRKGLSVIRFVAWKRRVVPACFCLIWRVEAGDLFDPSPLQWVAVVNPQALEWQPKEGKPRGVSLTSAAEHLQVSIMEMCTMDMDGYKCDGHHYYTICIRIYIHTCNHIMYMNG